MLPLAVLLMKHVYLLSDLRPPLKLGKGQFFVVI